MVNTLNPRQNGLHFPDDIFKCIFLNGYVLISIKIVLKFLPKGPVDNIRALVQIMDRHRPGDKPLPEAMVVKLLTHICITRPHWVNGDHIRVPYIYTHIYMYIYMGSALEYLIISVYTVYNRRISYIHHRIYGVQHCILIRSGVNIYQWYQPFDSLHYICMTWSCHHCACRYPSI